MKYLAIIIIIVTLLPKGTTQHFDPIYNSNDTEYRTWRDSGYYFVPEIINWTFLKAFNSNDQTIGIKVNFSSSDESSLMYIGKAILIVDRDKIPAGTEFFSRMKGMSFLMLPQDLLLCPSPDQEMAMGQNDPYFPLYLAGSIIQLQGNMLDEPIPITVQLNDLKVN